MDIETKQLGGQINEVKESISDGMRVGIVEGYLAAWSPDRGGVYGMPDLFHKGAFLKSIAEHKARSNRPVRLRDNHGRTVGGFPIETVSEDSFGLRVIGEINLEVQQGRELYALAQQKVVRDFSIGFVAREDKIDNGIRNIFVADIVEGSLVDEPMNLQAQILAVKHIVPFQDHDLADRMANWNSKHALDRIKEVTSSTQHPSDEYKSAFVWYDDEKPDEFKSYQFPIVDVIGDKIVAIPRAIFESSTGIKYGKVEIPTEDAIGVIGHLERYYSKMGLVSPLGIEDKTFFSNDEVKSFDRRTLERALVSTGAFSQKGAKILVARYDAPSNNEILDVLREINFKAT